MRVFKQLKGSPLVAKELTPWLEIVQDFGSYALDRTSC